MRWQTAEPFPLLVNGVTLEAGCTGPSPAEAPTIILLHEGLGCLRLWREFPQALARATGYGVFAYSRQGYGGSDPVQLPRPLDYMTREALDVLPFVLEQTGLRRGVLLGHSDGASIASLYLGNRQDTRINGLILIAPHFFTEPAGLRAIAEAKLAYETGDLRPRLAKYHRDPDGAFWGWNQAWLDPGFAAWNIEEALDYIRVPVLAIQGRDDQYGTLAQIEALNTRLYAPLDTCVLNDCRHAPFIEQPQATLAAITGFLERLENL